MHCGCSIYSLMINRLRFADCASSGRDDMRLQQLQRQNAALFLFPVSNLDQDLGKVAVHER